RLRTRSSTRGMRCADQGLSPSRSLAVASSRIGGSTVLSAANIHVIARARALASSGSRPAWRSAIWNTIAPCLEQGEIAFLVGWNPTERVKRQMSGFLHRAERNKANLVGWAHFFKRPAHTSVTRQSLAAIGGLFKGGNGDGHREAPPWPKSSTAGLASCQGKLTEIEDERASA